MIGFLLLVAVLFGFVVLFGAPYVPTRRAQINQALDLLDLKPGQTVYDLGSGDGRFLREAAKRGLKAVGYELNPILAIISLFVTWRCRRSVNIVWGNFWRTDLNDADGLFVFLVEKRMNQLDEFIKARKSSSPLKLVSYGFKIPGKKPAKQIGAMLLYKY